MGWLPLAAGEAPPWLAEVASLVVGAAVVLDDLRLESVGTPA